MIKTKEYRNFRVADGLTFDWLRLRRQVGQWPGRKALSSQNSSPVDRRDAIFHVSNPEPGCSGFGPGGDYGRRSNFW